MNINRTVTDYDLLLLQFECDCRWNISIDGSYNTQINKKKIMLQYVARKIILPILFNRIRNFD